jgi:SH3-like domain-containing protein
MKRACLAYLILVAITLACSRELPATITATATTAATKTPAATATRQWNSLVAVAFVNVRASPNGTVVGTLRAGDAVEVIECARNWCQIQEPGGWIWQGCLSEPPAGLGCRAR